MAKFDSAVMKKNLRLYLAAALLLTSAVLSWSAFKNFAQAPQILRGTDGANFHPPIP